MATVEICDICGKPILQYDGKKRYKIKKSQWSLYSLKNPWIECSAHTSCIKLLLAARDRNITVAEIEEEVKRRFIPDEN